MNNVHSELVSNLGEPIIGPFYEYAHKQLWKPLDVQLWQEPQGNFQGVLGAHYWTCYWSIRYQLWEQLENAMHREDWQTIKRTAFQTG